MVLAGTGTLGPLLEDVDSELDEMLPDRKVWYLTNAEEFRALEPPLT